LDLLTQPQLPDAEASATAEFSAFADALIIGQLGFGRDRACQAVGLLLYRALVNQALRNIRICCTKRVEYWNNARGPIFAFAGCSDAEKN
jgi:hypothetical protein